MITEYLRPDTIDEALMLLNRAHIKSIPLGGGTALPAMEDLPVAVVDLQAIGLETLTQRGNHLEIGAMVRLQALLEAPVPAILKEAIELEATYNLRQAASTAGTLVAADGRSPFAAVMLALDAQLTLQPGMKRLGLGDFLPVRREALAGSLIIHLEIPLNCSLAFETIGRSPADRPIVCAALAVWPSGRARLVLGGFGPSPLLVFDGADTGGLEHAARSAFSQAGDDWASAEYRAEMAAVLASRCLAEIVSS